MLQCDGAPCSGGPAVSSAMLIESAGVSRTPTPDGVKPSNRNEKGEAGWRWSGLLHTSRITNIYN